MLNRCRRILEYSIGDSIILPHIIGLCLFYCRYRDCCRSDIYSCAGVIIIKRDNMFVVGTITFDGPRKIIEPADVLTELILNPHMRFWRGIAFADGI